jgi:hypothetical protein
MDIGAEKEDIIRRFKQVHDVDLIKAIKSLLDFGIKKQESYEWEDDPELQASIERGLKDLDEGNVRSHEEVMADLKKRYNL